MWQQFSLTDGGNGRVVIRMKCNDTSFPTHYPSEQPTEEPTEQPSHEPSQQPTEQPSDGGSV